MSVFHQNSTLSQAKGMDFSIPPSLVWYQIDSDASPEPIFIIMCEFLVQTHLERQCTQAFSEPSPDPQGFCAFSNHVPWPTNNRPFSAGTEVVCALECRSRPLIQRGPGLVGTCSTSLVLAHRRKDSSRVFALTTIQALFNCTADFRNRDCPTYF